jgi:hypothetical protein
MELKIHSTHKIILIAALLLLLHVFDDSSAYGQVPPPPPPPNSGQGTGHGLGGNQGTPGAPIGGGLEIFLILGAIYYGKHVNQSREHKKEE